MTHAQSEPRAWWPIALACFLAGLAVGAGAWSIVGKQSLPPTQALTLTGAGASFPYPLYRRWFAEYGDSTGQRINYHSVGSAGGIYALSQEDVDFGASDRLLRASERAAMPCGDPIAVPTAVGAVAIAYHLPSLDRPLHLDVATIAAMFDGTITSWDDPRLRALNPQVQLPGIRVHVVHRSDGSGTSRAFLNFLGARAAAWSSSSGEDAPRWPVGTAVAGNEGVASEVQVTRGAIGYVEVSYARQMRLPVAAVENVAGAFVLPTTEAIAASANAAFRDGRADSVTSLIGVRDSAAYPIASLTWLLIPPQARDTTRANAVIALARWALARSPADVAQNGYAPIPRSVSTAFDARLRAHVATPCAPRPILPRPGV